jgi:protein-tyrosine phosphatase
MSSPFYFDITRVLLQGPFATPQRAAALRDAGVTHILNVGEGPSVLTVKSGFAEVVWRPVEDLQRVPDTTALACIDELHRIASVPGSRVYVHCVAGWNRSPTILWLYLVACGTAPEEAREMIARRTLDAVPGHGRLVDAELVRLVERHGQEHFLPLSRPEILAPPH